jgi:DNA-binding NtrC family response regulator
MHSLTSTHEPERRPAFGEISHEPDSHLAVVGFRSSSFIRALRQLELFAKDDRAAILIEGPPGTGKTRLARHVHQISSRKRGPFAQLTLSSIDDALASSELFGHIAGAFTDAKSSRAGLFVTATRGTVFLDEIGKASRIVQQKLLHVIEYGELRPVGSDRDVKVDVRLVAAANEPLADLSRVGAFLPDLYARLSVFSVRLPPLSERRADIPILVARYVRAHAARMGIPTPEVSPALMLALQRAPWPNNLRQLDATIHRLVVEADGAPFLSDDHASLLGDFPVTRRETAVTRAEVEAAVAKAGSMNAAARLLGVHRTTLYRAQRKNADG